MTELLAKIKSGQERQYILNPTPKKKLENQIYASHLLSAEGYIPYIEVKFVSQYSLREKRIEVAGIKGNQVKLCQFTSRASFDQDSTELSRLIQEISSLEIAQGYSFSGEVLLREKVNDLALLENALKDMNIDITIKNL